MPLLLLGCFSCSLRGGVGGVGGENERDGDNGVMITIMVLYSLQSKQALLYDFEFAGDSSTIRNSENRETLPP